MAKNTKVNRNITVSPARREFPSRRFAIALGLFLLTLGAYSNSFRSGLVFDNHWIIGEDPRIRVATAENIHQIWTKGYWYANEDPTLYRPLTTFSYLWNYAVLGNGLAPAGYHWVNWFLHWVNGLLVFGIALALFRKTGPAVALAALWSVHPVLTESVTNIVGRADLLSAFGVLAGLLCHIRLGAATGSRKLAWTVGVAAAAAIGIFSKESAAVLVAVLLLYDLAFRRNKMRVCVAGYAAAAVPLAIFLFVRSQVLSSLPVSSVPFVNNPLVAAGFWAARFTALRVIGKYLLLLIWPAALSVDYSYNQIPVFSGTLATATDWETLLAVAVCFALFGLLLVWYRRERLPFFLLAFSGLCLAPVANLAILIGTIMAERFLYLPALGFLGCVVWAVDRVMTSRPGTVKAVAWAAGFVCLLFALRTYMRNADWENERTLWSSGVQTSPVSYKTHLSLAVARFADAATIDEAVAEGERSLAILHALPTEHKDLLAYTDVGAHQRAKGDQVRSAGAGDAAKQWYEKALAILVEGEAIDREQTAATERLSRATGRPPGNYRTNRLYLELGQVYLRLQQPRKAIDSLEYGLKLQPDHELLQVLSEAHGAMNDSAGAAISLMEGLILYPDQRGFASELLALYQKTDPQGCAVQGSNLNPACPKVHGDLCTAAARARDLYVRRGEASEAEKIRATAVQSLGCPAL